MVYEELVELLGKDIVDEIYKEPEISISDFRQERIIEILQVLDEEEGIGREILKTNGNILALGEAGKIRDILQELKNQELDINDILSKNASILAMSSAEKIKKVSEVLRQHNLYQIVLNSPSIFRISSKNIEKIIRLVEREELVEIVKATPAILCSNSYTFLLSRINYLKEKGIQIKTTDEMGIERLNQDIMIPSGKFKEKYGISGQELKAQYGQESPTIKSILQDTMKKGELSEADISAVTQVEQKRKNVQTKIEE